MTRTVIGFEIQVVGQAPAAAAYAGFDRNRMVWLCLLTSGGLAGLAGLFEIAGPIGQLIPSADARLRLHRDHRRLPRPAASVWASSPRGC